MNISSIAPDARRWYSRERITQEIGWNCWGKEWHSGKSQQRFLMVSLRNYHWKMTNFLPPNKHRDIHLTLFIFKIVSLVIAMILARLSDASILLAILLISQTRRMPWIHLVFRWRMWTVIKVAQLWESSWVR